MLGLEFPSLNGIVPSWADIGVKTTGTGFPLIDMKDIQSINSGSSVEVGEQRGASGGRVMARTTGAVSYTASMVLYRTGYQKLLRNLAMSPEALSRGGGAQAAITLVHFDIVVQHTPPGSFELFEFRIKGCRITGREANDTEGSEPMVVDVALNPLLVVDVIDGREIAML